MTRLLWSAAARAELKAAYDYVAAENPVAAEKIIGRLEAAAELVSRRNIGRTGRRLGTFEKSVLGTRYVLVYTRDDDADITMIATVLHTAQDWRGTRLSDEDTQ